MKIGTAEDLNEYSQVPSFYDKYHANYGHLSILYDNVTGTNRQTDPWLAGIGIFTCQVRFRSPVFSKSNGL